MCRKCGYNGDECRLQRYNYFSSLFRILRSVLFGLSAFLCVVPSSSSSSSSFPCGWRIEETNREFEVEYNSIVATRRPDDHSNYCNNIHVKEKAYEDDDDDDKNDADSTRMRYILSLTGGLSKAADDMKTDYYEQFTLDYGKQDNERSAGSLRGFLKAGALDKISESDPFKKWLNDHLEKGPEEIKGRIKPFYAADFGTKSDLRKGENPKIMIVNRKLMATKDGKDITSTDNIDIEVREVWQPWLKRKCDFAVRYVIPSRVNIIKILEQKGRFNSQVVVDSTPGNYRHTKLNFIILLLSYVVMLILLLSLLLMFQFISS